MPRLVRAGDIIHGPGGSRLLAEGAAVEPEVGGQVLVPTDLGLLFFDQPDEPVIVETEHGTG